MNDKDLDKNEDELVGDVAESSHINEDFDFDVDLSEAQLSMSQFNDLRKRKRSATENSDEVYQITNERTTHSRKFNCSEKIVDIELNLNIHDYKEANERIKNMFQKIYDDFVSPIKDNQQIRMNFEHDLFAMPITIPFVKKKDITPTNILEHFESIVQSYKKRNLDEEQSKYKFHASFIVAEIPEGGHKHKNIPQKRTTKKRAEKLTFETATNYGFYEYCNEAKKSILPVYNKDQLCLLHAILIAKAYCDKEKKAHLLARQNNRELIKRVEKLAVLLNIKNGPCSIDMVKQIEEILKDYQIMIIDNQTHETKTIYLNKEKSFTKFIYISYTNQHFNVILSMKAFLKKSYFCDFCKIGYTRIGNHVCNNMCKFCQRTNCFASQNKKSCKSCNCVCRSDVCLKVHTEYVCDALKVCTICNEKKSFKHVCGFDQKWCINCLKAVSLDHQCYVLTESEKIQQKKKKFEKKFNGYIFFDYETYLDESGKHIPNLIMAQTICSDCLDTNERCAKDKLKHVFYSNDEFCSWLFKQKYYIAIAHNLKGYDGAFIMQFIYKNLLPKDREPSVIINGTKIISLDFRKVILKDSFSFVPMGLEKLPKTFELHELKKGFFPHSFNLPENKNYIGAYPDKSFYQPEYFSLEKKRAFENWYESIKNEKFDFKKEFHDYCWSDVQVLTEACLAFRKIIIEQTKISDEDIGIDPFRSSCTIASLCNLIYRRNFMKSKSIAIIPENGYNAQQKTSNKCLVWLKYLSSINRIFIQHARNKSSDDSIGGEKKIGRYLVDGYCEETNTIFEFHGCLFHACSKCYPNPNTWNPILQKSMGLIRVNHENRLNYIKKNMHQSKIIEIWECEFDEMCKTDTNLMEFIKKNPIQEPLMPRDALYGGRTNAFKLKYTCDVDTKINYFDYTSLYPYVQKTGKYPVGHPTIITENFDRNKRYFGLIKCVILPPRRLYIPVLPARINNKLIFTLCSTCAMQQNQETCTHSENHRSLHGTWVSEEVYKAVECGYKIIRYEEVWHWANTEQYDGKSGGIFTEYINKAIQEKQEASGYPANVLSDDDKANYIQNYFEKEGIILDKEKIIKNSGKRQVAKLKANSQWGFLAMKTNKIQHKIITDPADWYNMLSNKQYKIHDVDITNKSFIHVKFSVSDSMVTHGLSTNVVLASFVTTYARLKLLSELHKLNERVLYCDTDSIFFTVKPGEYVPELGDFLGEFTNELSAADGDYITEFISAGPKNYGYITNTGKSHTIVKGFTLNYIASQTVHYESIKEIVSNDRSKKLMVDQYKFKKNKHDWNVFTEFIKKQYGFVYDKRILNDDLTTLPFGY